MSECDLESIDLADHYETTSDPQFAHGRDLIELLALRSGEWALDIGCGTGRLARVAGVNVGPQGRIIGIDPAASRIEVARGRSNVCAEFHVASAEDLSAFALESFDVVYFNSVLGWLQDKPKALAEAYRVLKPGGRVGIATTVRKPANELRSLIRAALHEVAEGTDAVPHRARVAQTDIDETLDYSKRRLTLEDVRDLLKATAFCIRVLELRTYLSAFDDVSRIIAFLRAANCGTFLSNMTASSADRFVAALERVIAREIPASRRTHGIQLERHVLLAVADKPSD